MGTYARRSPLRFIAPVALVAFGLALLVVVSSSNSGNSDNTPSASEREKDRDLGTSTKKSKRKSKSSSANGSLPTRTYTVKSGDTLGSISEKTGIPIATLQELNPQLDPQQLVSGQKIKLKE
jgi:teichoic acid transport system ATP-binding protein